MLYRAIRRLIVIVAPLLVAGCVTPATNTPLVDHSQQSSAANVSTSTPEPIVSEQTATATLPIDPAVQIAE